MDIYHRPKRLIQRRAGVVLTANDWADTNRSLQRKTCEGDRCFVMGDGFMIWVVFLCLFFLLCYVMLMVLDSLDHGQACTGIMNGDTYLHMDGLGSLYDC